MWSPSSHLKSDYQGLIVHVEPFFSLEKRLSRAYCPCGALLLTFFSWLAYAGVWHARASGLLRVPCPRAGGLLRVPCPRAGGLLRVPCRGDRLIRARSSAGDLLVAGSCGTDCVDCVEGGFESEALEGVEGFERVAAVFFLDLEAVQALALDCHLGFVWPSCASVTLGGGLGRVVSLVGSSSLAAPSSRVEASVWNGLIVSSTQGGIGFAHLKYDW
eukprot:1676811-Pyramimonas_sp.AAC.1